MSVEMNREDLNYTYDNCVKVRYISDCDIIVPDTKPDIKNILEVSAKEQINEKSVSGGYITVTGVVNYNILYVSDDEQNSLQYIDYTSPFSRQISAECSGENTFVKVKGQTVHTEYSVHNSRKLNAKCAIDFESKVYKKDTVSVVTSVSDKDALPHRKKAVNNYNLLSLSEHTLHIDELCTIPEHSPKISQIVKCSMSVTEHELKTVANKAVFKGNVALKTLYLSDGELCSCDNEIPFTHIADVDTIPQDAWCDVDFEVKNQCVTSELDTDATMSQINAKADICITLSVFEEAGIEYISDIYSPDYQISVYSSDIKVSQLVDTINTQCIVNNTIRALEGDLIQKVYTMSTNANIENAAVGDNYISIDGIVNADVLYMTENGELKSINQKLPFECNLQTDRKYDKAASKINAAVDTQHSSYSIEGAMGINVRAVLKVTANLISDKDIAVINDIDFDENAKIDKSGQAGITVYFVQNGDSLWDIAKRYHTTESEIASINKLDDGISLLTGQQLLIPKR